MNLTCHRSRHLAQDLLEIWMQGLLEAQVADYLVKLRHRSLALYWAANPIRQFNDQEQEQAQGQQNERSLVRQGLPRLLTS